MTIKLMSHQKESVKFMTTRKAVLDFSDCGTGKTLSELMDFTARHKKDGKAALVVCPKSIMYAAWGSDIKKFTPHLKVSLAYAKNRQEALNTEADVYVINVDGVKDLLKFKPTFWKKFGTIICDESDAYKHHTSQRSKALSKIIKNFEWRRFLSGTPTSNGICDLWHIAYLADGGKRLGTSFFGFRSACCTPEQVGSNANMLRWTDKEGIELQIGALIADIVIRHKFEDCVDIPQNHIYAVPTQLTAKHRKVYDTLESNAFAILEDTSVTAINKAVLMGKLLQCVSGAVYNDDGGYSLIESERYEIAIDLVEARAHSVVFYTWEHQLVEMIKLAKARKISHVTWDSNHPEIETDFQAGKYRVLFAHPASAGHGLTLTKGTTTIWPSPTYNLTHFRQGLKRIHRIGQKEKTETIVIVAEDTRDELAWEALNYKGKNMDALLKEFE